MVNYINLGLRLGTIIALLTIVYIQNQKIKELKADTVEMKIMSYESDSLKSEIYSKDIEIGRYSRIMDLIDSELEPDCQLKVEELKHQVE